MIKSQTPTPLLPGRPYIKGSSAGAINCHFHEIGPFRELQPRISLGAGKIDKPSQPLRTAAAGAPGGAAAVFWAPSGPGHGPFFES